MDIPLNVSRSTTFDGNGIARVRLAPSIYGTAWRVRQISVSTTSTAVTSFTMYLNVENATAKLEQTLVGNGNTLETDRKLQALDTLICEWNGGDVGAFATVVMTGTMETGR